MEGLGSGQTQLTVNQPLRLRRFESCPLHHNVFYFHNNITIILLHLFSELSINANGVLGLGLLIFKHSFLSCIQCSKLRNAHIAQSVEHFLGKEEVTGSNPVMSSIDLNLQYKLKRKIKCLRKNLKERNPI